MIRWTKKCHNEDKKKSKTAAAYHNGIWYLKDAAR